MRNEKIYLCLAHMSGREQKFIQEAFDTNWVVPLGPNVNGFEADLSGFLGGRPVVALSAGTAAIHISLLHCGVSYGDEVICQSFTFCATANPIKYLGATPVFVDSEQDSWNMDPDLLETAIKNRIAKTGRKPKAIILVYLYGMPAKIDEIQTIARRYETPLIEDAAEALGSRFNGLACGTLGDYGILSFNGNKMITTSGGGALVCPNEEVKKQVMFYATQAREPHPYYQHEKIGFNYRMSNICAGIGRGQMTVLSDHIEHHRHTFELYRELLAGIDGVKLHSEPSGRYYSNYWLNAIELAPTLRIKGESFAYEGTPRSSCEPNANVEALRLIMNAEGIETRPLWKPLHLQPVFADCPKYENGISESLFKTGLCLPSGPCVSDEDIRYIVNLIKTNIE